MKSVSWFVLKNYRLFLRWTLTKFCHCIKNCVNYICVFDWIMTQIVISGWWTKVTNTSHLLTFHLTRLMSPTLTALSSAFDTNTLIVFPLRSYLVFHLWKAVFGFLLLSSVYVKVLAPHKLDNSPIPGLNRLNIISLNGLIRQHPGSHNIYYT